MKVGGITFNPVGAQFFSDGSVHDAELAEDSVIQGLPCARGRAVVFYPHGQLKLAWLSDCTTIDGIPCAAGRVIYLHENGAVLNASLSKRHVFRGISLAAGSRVTVSHNGVLREYSQRLNKDALIDGLPCCALFDLWRYANGRLSRLVLSAACLIRGVACSRWTEISLGRRGALKRHQLLHVDSSTRYRQRVFGVIEADWT